MPPKTVSSSIVVDAPAEIIFNLLADPARHCEIDGSNSVKGAVRNPARLSKGAKFRMRMFRYGVPYLITNTVVEFEENRRIAWRHWGRHVWRWQLEPVDANRTKVTETFDWGPAPFGFVYPRLGYPKQNARDIKATLNRLADRFGMSAP